MSNGDRILAGGAGAQMARAIVGIVADTLTATGSTQATALALPADINIVTTTAASTGVILPPGNAGDEIEVCNLGANSLSVYPPLGGQINNVAVNTALALATLKSGKYKCRGGLNYYSLLSA